MINCRSLLFEGGDFHINLSSDSLVLRSYVPRRDFAPFFDVKVDWVSLSILHSCGFFIHYIVEIVSIYG